MVRKLMILTGIIVLLGGLSWVAAHRQETDFSRYAGDWPNTDFSKSSVEPSEIIRGGPPIDGIPPYYPDGYVYPDNVPYLGGQAPRFYTDYVDIETTNAYLPDEQQVIVVAIEDEARAYPLILLNNHEIVNTELASIPLAVTFCPLCNASIVYDRRIDGQEYHFGVSGLLRNSDLIMWDHETQSWWQQFTGEAIVGELTGTTLVQIPSLVTSWGEFKAEYPNGLVLRSPRENPLSNISYAGYDASGDTFLFFGEEDNRLFSTERVLGYFGAEGAIAYPLSRLAEVGVVNDRIGGEPVVVFWQPGAVSLFTSEIETGSAALYSATLEDGRELSFVSTDNVITDTQTASTWNVFGRATEGQLAGTKLRQLFAYPHFWFAWYAFRPDTLVWEQGMIADEAWEAEQ